MRIRNSSIPCFTVDHFNQARFSLFPGIPQQSKCSIPKQIGKEPAQHFMLILLTKHIKKETTGYMS